MILATQVAEIRRITVGGQPGKIVHEMLSQKHPAQTRASEVAQVVERLPSKHKALSSNPSTTNKQQKCWDFNTHLPVVSRSSRQKISKDIICLKSTTN
jgi:hypothetical protein